VVQDLLGVLEDHPRVDDVEALLVEFDGRNTAEIDRRAAAAGWPRVPSRRADAGSTDALQDVAPVDVLLLCGMLGNITMIDAADDKFTVGLKRIEGDAVPFEPGHQLFDFVGFDQLIARGE
jgi:hypothetical protein